MTERSLAYCASDALHGPRARRLPRIHRHAALKRSLCSVSCRKRGRRRPRRWPQLPPHRSSASLLSGAAVNVLSPVDRASAQAISPVHSPGYERKPLGQQTTEPLADPPQQGAAAWLVERSRGPLAALVLSRSQCPKTLSSEHRSSRLGGSHFHNLRSLKVSIPGPLRRRSRANERLIISMVLARKRGLGSDATGEHLTQNGRCDELLTLSPQHLVVRQPRNRYVVWRARRGRTRDLLIRSPKPAQAASLPYLVLNRAIRAARIGVRFR